MKELKNTDFAFLTSMRFHKLVLIGVIQALLTLGVISAGEAEAVAQIIQLILGGDITIRTIDRLGEKAGAKVD